MNVLARYPSIAYIGTGFAEESLRAVCRQGVDFVGADAGSIDGGPFSLAGIGTTYSRQACKRDLRVALTVANEFQVPLLVGSCGGSGRDWAVDWFGEIVEEIMKEENISGKIARIYSEISKDYVREKLGQGRVAPLWPSNPLDEETIDKAMRIVGMMGVEPYQVALDQGADIVLAGRSTDTAIFAAVPISKGADPALAWLAAKIAECGTAAADPPKLDVLSTTIYDDCFVVEPADPNLRCTPMSVAAHVLYENASPLSFTEPSGTVDASDTRYEAVSDRAVKVSGAKFRPSPKNTVKLEAVEPVGWQHSFILSMRDPLVLESLDEWLESADAGVTQRIEQVFGPAGPGEIHITKRVYGVDGTMGSLEPTPKLHGHEVSMLVDVIADDADTSSTVAAIIWYALMHGTIAKMRGFPTAAWPYNPQLIDRGLVYRFSMNHVVEMDSPLEAVMLKFEDVRNVENSVGVAP